MRYCVFATDYDGTIAIDGTTPAPVLEALRRVRKSGRKLVLVTGRRMSDLLEVLPDLALFDRVVAENGALLYTPATREERLLALPPPPDFIETLRQRAPVAAGRVVVATVRPYEAIALETIRVRGLELQLIFNQEAVMVLPPGVNKSTGLQAAIEELGISAHNVVGIGNAENDHAFLEICEFAAAVGDALPALREKADWVTPGGAGEGAIELAEQLLADDLASFAPGRHDLLLGIGIDGTELRVNAYGESFVIAGGLDGPGMELAEAFLERLEDGGYQYCLVDARGDFPSFKPALTLGAFNRPFETSDLTRLLGESKRSVSVNLSDVPPTERAKAVEELFVTLLASRAKVGRPHWIVANGVESLPAPGGVDRFQEHLLIMAGADPASKEALTAARTLVAAGQDPGGTLRSFARALGIAAPSVPAESLPGGEGIVWRRDAPGPPLRFRAQRERFPNRVRPLQR